MSTVIVLSLGFLVNIALHSGLDFPAVIGYCNLIEVDFSCFQAFEQWHSRMEELLILRQLLTLPAVDLIYVQKGLLASSEYKHVV